MQQAMVYRTLTAADEGDYVQQLWWTWKGPFDEAHFRSAWQILSDRHEVLRSGFDPADEDGIAMVIHPSTTIQIERHRFKGRRHQDKDRERDRIQEQDRRQGFEIDQPPLMRFTLFERSQEIMEILWTSHHALFDGRGRLILLEEFQIIYQALTAGESPTLDAPANFTDYADWYASADFRASEEFWRDQLSGMDPATHLSLGHPGNRARDGKQLRHSVTLDPDLGDRLRTCASDHRLSLNTLVQGAWALILSKMTGQTRVVFGAPRAGRHPPIENASSMVGVFVNTVPVHVDIDADQDKLQWLKSIRARWIQMRTHEQTPLIRIRNAVNWPVGTPLYESLVGYERYQLSDLLRSSLPGVSWDFRLDATTEIPLTIQVYDGTRIRIEITYDPDRFASASIRRLAGRYRTVLGGLSDPAFDRVGEVPLMDADEAEILSAWSRHPVEYPSNATIHSLFTERAMSQPDSIALETDDGTMTYGQVEALSNRLAHHLIKQGVAPEDRVGLLYERSLDELIAVLGILKAGAAYLPLDPDYPRERLELLIRDGGVRTIITEPERKIRLKDREITVIRFQSGSVPASPGGHLPTPPEVKVGPDSPAYVMFTSGSTGRPKGVEVPHRAVVRLVFGVDYVDLGPEHTFLYLAPAAFDAATFEIWGALLHGSRLVIYPDRLPTIEKLGACLRDHGVDTLWLTCSLFNFIIDEAPEILRPIAQLLTGGEALSPSHIARAQASLPGTQLINGYGPTETTTFACCHPIPPGFDRTNPSVSIGRPIGNTNCHVLDPRMRPVPIEMVGELFIGGAGVARGYLNRPEMTAERFIESPFHDGDRLYRTGDLVRWTEDGRIEYIGRIDNQVKIRGHRIEPGEIESVLLQHDEVRQAAVLVETHPVRGNELAVYVVASAPDGPDESELKSYLEARLPPYLVPVRYRVLETLPRNPNGKIDRNALANLPPPESGSDIPPPVRAGTLEPANDEERLVCKVYSEILDLPEVGVDDSFFALGGDSLRASQLVFRLSRSTGIEIELLDLNSAPDPRRLACLIQKHRGLRPGKRSTRIVRLRKRHDLPATNIQSSYYRSTTGAARKKAGNISRAFRIRGDLDLPALRRSIDLFIARHEAMRTALKADPDGTITQTVIPEARVVIQRSDLSSLPARRRLAEAKARFREDSRTPINLKRPPAIRVRVTRLAKKDHFLSFFIAHGLFDAVSLAIFYRELSAFYRAYTEGVTPDWPVPKHQLIDYLAFNRRRLTDEIQQKSEVYWRRALENAPADTWFPSDAPVTDQDNGRDRSLHFLFPPELTNAVRELSRRSQSTVFMTMMALNAVLVERHTGQSDFLVISVVDIRDHPSAHDIVGPLAGAVWFRARPRSDRTFAEFLSTSTREWLEAVQHRHHNAGYITREILAEQNREGEQFTPFFITHGADDPGALDLAGSRVSPIHRHFGAGPHLPKLEIRDTAAGISLLISYRGPTFKKRSILRYVERYQDLADLLARDPDRHLYSLPDYRIDAPPTDESEDLPSIRQTVGRIMSSLLGRESLPTGLSFYDLGGDSLTAMRLLQRVHREVGVAISIDQFNVDPTVQGIAGLARSDSTRPPALLPAGPGNLPPLSPKHAWLLRRLEAQGLRSLNFICRIFDVEGNLDHRVLTEAINLLVARHDALRMCFQKTNTSEIRYRVFDKVEVTIPVVDLSGWPRTERDREVKRILAYEMGRPIDHLKPRPLRVRVLKLSETRSVLLLSVLHCVSDGRSLQILYGELSTIYRALLRGETPDLSPEPIQFGSIERWNATARDLKHDRTLAYWSRQLAPPLPQVCFPVEHSPTFQAPEEAHRFLFDLPGPLQSRLQRIARDQGASLFATLLTGFVSFLSRTAGAEELVVSSGIDGRFHPDSADTIGDFSNNITIRWNLSDGPTFESAVRGVTRQLRAGIAHGLLHQSRFQELAGVAREPAGQPFMPVKFSEGPEYAESLELEGLRLRPRQRTRSPVFLMTDVAVRSFRNRTWIEVAYPIRFYSEEWVRQMTRAYLRYLKTVAADPQMPLSEIPAWQFSTEEHEAADSFG